jgi:starch phosphorylase
MVRDYVTQYYEPAGVGTNTMTADDADPARHLAAWKHRVRAAWPGVGVHLIDDGSDIDAGAAGHVRNVVAELESGDLDSGDLAAQLVHGPLLGDGSFDEAELEVVPMAIGDDGRYRASFAPDRAGRWGVAARVLPSHPHQRSVFDTGLIAIG